MTDFKYTLVPDKAFGFLKVSPSPTTEEIDRFYKEEFYSGDYKNFNDSSLEVQLDDEEFYKAVWSEMEFNIDKILNKPLDSLKMLDIGCGWAQSLMFFSSKGMECYGFDPAPEAVDYAVKKGLNVKLAGMDKMEVFSGLTFDVVVLNNVLEHLANPIEALTEIHQRVINPGGLIIVDVPNEFNTFQTAARDIHNLNNWWVVPPVHLNYFSGESLKNTLNGTGFKVDIMESSFPMEIFLLFGDNYVGNHELGRACHKKRVAFEENMRKTGNLDQLRKFYQALANLNLGRQVTAYAISE